jgi:riboflavin biosynthesis pyrimidine reductase
LRAVPRSTKLPAFELLFASRRAGVSLPRALARAYGGGLNFPIDSVVANFVASPDGVAALPSARGESGGVISGGAASDRLLMGTLRACADAVLIGAGTLRAAPKDLWLPQAIFPAAAPLYASLRAKLRLPVNPRLYVVSGSGRIDMGHPALKDASVLRGKLQPAEIVASLRADGHRRILCEGGPGLFAELVAANQIDGLFLTVSPHLFGRWPGDERKAIAEGRDLGGRLLDLHSVRRSGGHLFLRYQLASAVRPDLTDRAEPPPRSPPPKPAPAPRPWDVARRAPPPPRRPPRRR